MHVPVIFYFHGGGRFMHMVKSDVTGYLFIYLWINLDPANSGNVPAFLKFKRNAFKRLAMQASLPFEIKMTLCSEQARITETLNVSLIKFMNSFFLQKIK